MNFITRFWLNRKIKRLRKDATNNKLQTALNEAYSTIAALEIGLEEANAAIIKLLAEKAIDEAIE